MTSDPEWQRFLEQQADVRFVEVDRHRIRVVDVGQGEPVLLIHGFGDSAYTWHRNLPALAQAGFRALAYDYPGCGKSSMRPDFHFGVDNLARLAIGVLDALGVERAHVIGSSMGGGIGLHLAVHYPHRLRRVILVAPTCYHAPFRSLIFPLRHPPFSILVRWLTGAWTVRAVLRSQYVDPTLLTPEVVAQYQIPFERPEYLPACEGLLRDYWNSSFIETARHYGEIQVPLYLVWGDQDFLVNPRYYALRLAGDTGADLAIIPEVGHLVQQAKPQAFNERMIGFLKGE